MLPRITGVLLTAALAAGGVGLSLAAREPGANTAATVAASPGSIDYLRSIDTSHLEQYAKPRSFWGKLLEWVAGPGDRPWLARPYALTDDSRGRLFIADPGLGIVHILDFERRKYEQLIKAGRERLVSPIGVAVDADDNVYVSDSIRGRVYVFNRQGKFLRALGNAGGQGLFKRPTGLAIDQERRLLYLADTLRHQVLVLDLNGTLLRTIGQRGTGPREFNFPTALTLARGKLYVVDAMNFRVQVLTPQGEFIRAFGREGNRSGTLNRPKGIAVDSDGNVYVVDALFETVQVFDPEGRLLYYFGKTGAGPGEFVQPSGIYIAPRDRIFIADSLNGRVQVFRYRRGER